MKVPDAWRDSELHQHPCKARFSYVELRETVWIDRRQCSFDAKTLTYNEGPIGPLRLRKAMASHLNTYFSPFVPVTHRQITFMTGITALNEMIAFNLCDEGEAILLGRLIYGAFAGDLVTKSNYVSNLSSQSSLHS